MRLLGLFVAFLFLTGCVKVESYDYLPQDLKDFARAAKETKTLDLPLSNGPNMELSLYEDSNYEYQKFISTVNDSYPYCQSNVELIVWKDSILFTKNNKSEEIFPNVKSRINKYKIVETIINFRDTSKQGKRFKELYFVDYKDLEKMQLQFDTIPFIKSAFTQIDLEMAEINLSVIKQITP